MTVREALEKQVGDSLCGRCSFNPCRACVADEVKRHFVEGLAPKIERALQTSARKMQLIYDIPLTDKVAKEEVEECVTAGIAAMVEEL